MIVSLPDAAATRAAGAALGRHLAPGDQVALEGPLGAGKTTLAQGLAAALGVTGEVTSPTYALMNVLEGRCPVYHLDLYRLDSPERLRLLGYEEEEAQTGVTLVEWSDRHWPFWNPDVLKIRLSPENSGRMLRSEGTGPRSMELERLWQAALQP